MNDMFDPWPDLRDVWEAFEADLAYGWSADSAVCGVQLMLVDYVRKSLNGLGVNLDDPAVRAVARLARAPLNCTTSPTNLDRAHRK
jgi:hypothetical protein